MQVNFESVQSDSEIFEVGTVAETRAGAILRGAPSETGVSRAVFLAGVGLTVIGEVVDSGGVVWVPVSDGNGTDGWVKSGELIVTQSAPASVSKSVPMFRGNLSRTGEMAGPGPNPNSDVQEMWRFSTGGAVLSSPAVVDGVLFVGSDDGNVYSVDALTGTERWRFATEGAVFSSPAVANQMVYIGSSDDNVYALDAETGGERWRFNVGNDVLSSPAVADDMVFVSSHGGVLYAIDALTGVSRWEQACNGAGADLITSSPTLADGAIYAGTDWGTDGVLCAKDPATGDGLGSQVFAMGITSTLVVSNSNVFVAAKDGLVAMINPAQYFPVWQTSLGNVIFSSPALSEGIIYLGCDNYVFAVDGGSGEVIWDFATQGQVDSSPAIADGVLYIGSEDGNLYALDAQNGTELWRFSASGGIFSSPAVVDGVVYFGSRDGYIYAIGNV